MGSFLELLYDVLFHPGAAMRVIASRELVGQGLLAFLAGVAMPLIALHLKLTTSGMAHLVTLIATVQVCGSLALWIMGTGLLHLIAELLGGQGTAKGLLAALGFAQFPRVFLIPVWIMGSVFSGELSGVFAGASIVAILLWIMALHISAIKAVYHMGTARAVAVLMAPFVILLLSLWMLIHFISAQFSKWPFPPIFY